MTVSPSPRPAPPRPTAPSPQGQPGEGDGIFLSPYGVAQVLSFVTLFGPKPQALLAAAAASRTGQRPPAALPGSAHAHSPARPPATPSPHQALGMLLNGVALGGESYRQLQVQARQMGWRACWAPAVCAQRGHVGRHTQRLASVCSQHPCPPAPRRLLPCPPPSAVPSCPLQPTGGRVWCLAAQPATAPPWTPSTRSCRPSAKRW